jgi:hypothetical protein
MCESTVRPLSRPQQTTPVAPFLTDAVTLKLVPKRKKKKVGECRRSTSSSARLTLRMIARRLSAHSALTTNLLSHLQRRASSGLRRCRRLMSFRGRRRARVSLGGWAAQGVDDLATRHFQRCTPPPLSPSHPLTNRAPHPPPQECCIFHKQRSFGDWSDGEDSDGECCGPAGDGKPDQQQPPAAPPPGPPAPPPGA